MKKTTVSITFAAIAACLSLFVSAQAFAQVRFFENEHDFLKTTCKLPKKACDFIQNTSDFFVFVCLTSLVISVSWGFMVLDMCVPLGFVVLDMFPVACSH